MADQFLAEIRIFGFNFAPVDWAFCDGQIMPISQNTALFSLIGTYYGGDGRVTFGLPNIQGNCVLAPGPGPGLSPYQIGETVGVQTVTLTNNQLPAHTHAMRAHAGDPADLNAPNPNRSLARSSGGAAYGPPTGAVQMASGSASTVGGGAAHNNMQPFVSMNFCIALKGIYPPRP